MKFAARYLHNSPPYLAYVAALSWEVKSPNLLKITKGTTQKSYRVIKMKILHVIWQTEY